MKTKINIDFVVDEFSRFIISALFIWTGLLFGYGYAATKLINNDLHFQLVLLVLAFLIDGYLSSFYYLAKMIEVLVNRFDNKSEISQKVEAM